MLGGELFEVEVDELDTEGVEALGVEGCCMREEFPPQTIMREAAIGTATAKKYVWNRGRMLALLQVWRRNLLLRLRGILKHVACQRVEELHQAQVAQTTVDTPLP